ncbi:hypothetical protein DH2020_024640 [Rehmannia glutinosa]|uniref:Hexosyltransferase n=1 Tax=Rehmannia glutinosa TaxID=99300 RepID=A0ABR0W2Q6_REHGL
MCCTACLTDVDKWFFNSIGVAMQESEGLKEPLVVYKDDTSKSAANLSSSEDTSLGEVRKGANDADLSENSGCSATRHDADESGQKRHLEERLAVSRAKEESRADRVQLNKVVRSRSRIVDEKVKEMKDQVIRAKAYLNFTPSNSSSHMVKELKLRIKEVERAMSQSTKDSRLSRSSLQKMKAMEATLSKASRIYPDCAAMIRKLRAMTYNAEEQVRSQRNQETFLRALGGRTIPKGLHCLSMRLTAEYFALEPEEREFRYKHKLQNPHFYHFAVFSDNILACSVVVNSTISTAREPEKIVFHVVTDSLNLPAMSMWFLINPPGKATVHVESMENFHWLTTKYNVTLQREGSIDPRYISELNHLRFYLPDVFPRLNKVVLLDHDVGNKRPLWKEGSLPIGWLTFYTHTLALDKNWHILGLGHDSNVRQEDIDQASVIHFDGIRKPWLDIGIERYKHLWRKHVKYEHPYLQQCNVHE